MITVLQAENFTSIQDQGRFGYQAWGLPVSGAMDRYACTAANFLVGNEKEKAVVEMTGSGGSFKFDQKTFVSICGADMQARIDGQKIENWRSFFVPAGGVLHFGKAVKGYRTYLAVQGGIDVPLVMGSRSTYTRATLGGFEGRCLLPGDVLYMGKATGHKDAQMISRDALPVYEEEISLRVLRAMPTSVFGKTIATDFFAEQYTIAEDSDRVSYVLNGPEVALSEQTDIISMAVPQGAIQITSSGRPNIVASDHGTIRGFGRIGYVIQADLPKLAQARPGTRLSFREITEQDAVAIWREQRETLIALA